MRTDGNPSALTTAFRDAVREAAPTQPLFGIQTMEQVLGESMSLRRFLMLLIGIFAAIAVVLGIVGVDGVRLKPEATLSLIGLVGAIADGVYSCARLAVMNSDRGDANGARRTGNARETSGSVHVDAVITASR